MLGICAHYRNDFTPTYQYGQVQNNINKTAEKIEFFSMTL